MNDNSIHTEPCASDAAMYIVTLSVTFRPAPDAEHTTHWFTTSEIWEAVKAVDPGCDVSKNDIHQAMLDAGYQYRSRPGAAGIDFRWMLQER